MIVLAIESATELCGVAVADDDGARSTVWSTGRRHHGEALTPAIGHVLEQAELSLGDVDVVAVDVGPGLFTGLRVGVVTAKAVAQGLGIGVIGVSSLDVAARAGFDAGWSGPVVAVVDARRGEVFAKWFDSPADPVGEAVLRSHQLPAAAPPAAAPPAAAPLGTGTALRLTPAALVASLAGDTDVEMLFGLEHVERRRPGAPPTAPCAKVLAVGDGARRYADELEAVSQVVVAGPNASALKPDVVAVLASEAIAAGAVPVSPAEIQPLYLRDADARINWTQRRSAPTR
ncbi:MAG: tRNA (adenosine(37)-N6)-threonylcarbamoyltransferase complex dimerization subunit type 1 TsaB [Actinomycetota bacterium]|jgi:tRNA threonylcarbamoyladenosine biosynthesis protein TsaB|nr:tRNA (adenosine(37)-N6)-threonylcarbamoyltransferase complex dimerization subunit type 1 TsaB [Actinomycetota bacterium]